MDASVICAAISAASAIVVAIMNARQKKETDKQEAERKNVAIRAKRRQEESMLQISLANANMELSIACCNALCGGTNNGNVEKARKHAEEASKAYTDFMARLLAEELS